MKALSKWIEVTGHFDHETDGEYVYDCELPEDGQEILVTLIGGAIGRDICHIDKMGYHLESGWDWDDVFKWAPMPPAWWEGGNGMTKKEVINFLDQVRKILLDDKSWLESTIQPINEAFDMAISALTAQSEERTKERTEMHACDLIDRQALMKEFSDFVRASNNSDFARTPTWNDAVSLVGSMPLAQQDLQPTCNQLATDSISRQAAIDLVEGLESARLKGEIDLLYPKVVKRLIGLPSVQPDDWMERNKERILQAGMEGREIEFRIGGRLFAIREKAQ